MDTILTGGQEQQLRDALVAAFPKSADLAQMVSFGLGESLTAITSTGDLDAVTFELIDWAKAHSKVSALIEAALQANRDNILLQTLAEVLGLGPIRRRIVRAAYAHYLTQQHADLDLKFVLPKAYEAIYGTCMQLAKIYVPLLVNVTSQRRVSAQSESDSAAQEQAQGKLRLLDRELIKTYPVLVVTGSPGSGMSLFLKHLALDLLDRGSPDGGGPLPILLRLADYGDRLAAQPDLSLRQFAADFYTEKLTPKPDSGPRPDGEVVAEAVGPGIAALFGSAERALGAYYLLDSLNEVRIDMRTAVSKKVVELATSLEDGNRLVMTSRTAGYIPLDLDGYVEAVLQPLAADKRVEFVNAWYEALSNQRAGGPLPEGEQMLYQLLDQIRPTTPMSPLAENPRTLTVLTLLFLAGQKNLPAQRINLYELVTQTLIEDLPQQSGGAYSEQAVVQQLGRLAYWLRRERPGGWATEAEVLSHLSDNADEATRLLALYDDAGLLMSDAEGCWAFRYSPIEEYLTARYIAGKGMADPDTLEDEIRDHASDSRWIEVIRLAIAQIARGEAQDQRAFAARVIRTQILDRPDEYEADLHRNLLLAGRVLVDSRDVDETLRHEVVTRLLDLLLTTHVPVLINSARAILLELKDPIIAREVAAAIRERRGVDRLVQVATVPELWDAGPRVIPYLDDVRDELLSLLIDPDHAMRRIAADALEQSVAARTHREDGLNLARSLHNLGERDDIMRVVAIRELAAMVDHPIVHQVLVRLLADSNSEICMTAAEALGKSKDAGVVDHLLPLLADRAWCVRAAAALALKEFTTKSETADKVVAALYDLLNNESSRVRAAAAEALINAPASADRRTRLSALLNDPATAGAAFGTLARWAEAAAS